MIGIFRVGPSKYWHIGHVENFIYSICICSYSTSNIKVGRISFFYVFGKGNNVNSPLWHKAPIKYKYHVVGVMTKLKSWFWAFVSYVKFSFVLLY